MTWVARRFRKDTQALAIVALLVGCGQARNATGSGADPTAPDITASGGNEATAGESGSGSSAGGSGNDVGTGSATGVAGGQPAHVLPEPTTYGMNPATATRVSLLPGSGDWDVEIDSEGSVIVGGWDAVGSSSGVSITKFGPNRALAWTKWISTGSHGWFGNLTVVENGDVVGCGGFIGRLSIDGHTLDSTANPGEPGSYDRGELSADMFLLRLTPAGSVVWVRRFGGIADQICRNVVRGPNDSLILVGNFAGKLELGAFTLISSYGSTGSNVLIAQLDEGGNPTSAQQLDDIGMVRDVVVDSLGNLVIASIGGAAPDSDYLGIGVIDKLDVSGVRRWTTSLGSEAAAEPVRLAVDRADNVLLVASAYQEDGTVFFDEPMGDAGIGLAKLDPDGNLIFAKTFGSFYLDHAWGVAAGADDSIWLTGGYRGSIDFGGGMLGGQTPGDSRTSIFVVMLGPNGEHRFSFSPGGVGSGTAIAATADQVVAAGSFETAVDFGEDVLRAQNGSYILWMGL